MFNWGRFQPLLPMTATPRQSDNRIPRLCPLCDGREATRFMEKGSLRLVQCNGCSMIYANPIEPELASGKSYDRLGTPFYLSPDKLEAIKPRFASSAGLRWFGATCGAAGWRTVGCWRG